MKTSNPSSSLAYILHHVAFNLDRQSDQILLEQLGVGFAQFKILMALQVNPIVGQKELSESLSQTQASISRQIKILRSKGMIVSRINPKNRRQHLTLITAKGQKIREAAIAILDKQYEEDFSSIGKKSIERLQEDLGKLTTINVSPDKHEGYRHLWENIV